MHQRTVRKWQRRLKRLKLLVQVHSRPLRIILGSGAIRIPGWIMTDIDQLDMLREKDWASYFRPGSIDAILAEHVWEHLTADEGLVAAKLCQRYLRSGGHLRVAVPDGLHPDPDYVDKVRPGGSGAGADDHKILYTMPTLRKVFENAGFEVTALEYFDEQGKFHAREWDPEQGMIRRSARYDPRNGDGMLRYTSIVLDARKNA